ncbi:hypothetical protein LCGC14_3100220, partial [marine sediment metagenome]
DRMERRKVCHNCSGKGVVEGGFNKRIERESGALESQRANELQKITEKDKKKKGVIERQINDGFDLKLREKGKESPGFTGTCAYCNGTGSRG